MILKIKGKKVQNIELFYGLCVLMMFFLYNVYNNFIYISFGLILMIISLMIFDFYQLFLCCMIMIPNIMMIKFSTSNLAILSYFLMLVYGKYIFDKKANLMKMSISIPIHLIFVIITVFFYKDFQLFTMLIRGVLFCFTLCLLSKDTNFNNEKYRNNIIKYYLIGITFCVLFGITQWILKGSDIFNGLFSGIRNDRNYFASLLSSGIAINLLYILYGNKKIIWYCPVFIMLFGGLLSCSRTFFMSMLFVLIILIAITRKASIKSIKVWALLVIGLLLFRNELLSLLDTILIRFSSDDIAGGNGRFDSWNFYLNIMKSTPLRVLIGNGSSTKYISMGMIDIVEHNTLVQLLSTTGLLGTISYILMYCDFIKRTIKKLKGIKLHFLMPLCSVLFCYFSINGLYSDNFNFSVLVSLIIINLCRNSSNKKEVIL